MPTKRILLAATAAVALLSASSASAATIAVTSNGDAGAGTLRAAIAAANPGDTITVPAMTITLSSGELPIAENLTIAGAGAGSTIVSGGNISRVFHVSSGTVTISGMTITDGTGAPASGMPAVDGGAVLADGNVDLTLSDDSITNNRSGSSEEGGGVDGTGHSLTLMRDLVAGNTSSSAGGGIGSNSNDKLAVINTTVANNIATEPYTGGGIFANDGGNGAFVNDTITGNSVAKLSLGGGGIDVQSRTGDRAVNLIVANNTGPAGLENCANIPTGFSLGHNIEDRHQCGFTAVGDIIDTNPQLGPLGNNGGPTETEVPLAGSPVVGGGANFYCPMTDQRAIPRPQGTYCDIGAVELTTPTGTTGQAVGITESTATLQGIANTQGLPGTAHFLYGTTTNFGATATVTLQPEAGAQSPSMTLSGLKPSTTYYFTLVVTTPDGTANSTTATFKTSTPLPLVLSALSTSPASFRLGSAKGGTTISFTLSRAASATLSFTQLQKGVLRGHRCVARRRHSHGRSCQRSLAAGGLSFAARGGLNKIRFDGVLTGRKHLVAGRYLLTVGAVAADGVVATPATIKLTAVPALHHKRK
jgi:hypothetical protein